ncbi:MAG TPA: molybdenum cofactor guanylyltransferase [Candidatus Hydrogenedentes bacterium]|nr:molybdenum cofactor guanylyltransferase [Candidatus Hydrogenedentota bacterium]
MHRLPVYILAGGRSSRFGEDKARALWRGKPLLSRVAGQTETVASRITVVAQRADAYADLGLCGIADVHPGCGPLGGLQAALRDCAPEPWLLLLSCDMVPLPPDWLQRLLAGRRDGVGTVYFQGRRPEPFPALFHYSVAPVVDALIEAGRLAMVALFFSDSVCGHPMPLPEDWRACRNINRPADLDHEDKVFSSTQAAATIRKQFL